jgi:hypothetical protein
MINVIVPCNRPQFLERLLLNFERQQGERRLIIVENGPLIGAMPRLDSAVYLESSVEHHAAAKNVALAWLRANGGGAWTTFDDDDHYGSRYLTEVRQSLEGTDADVVGKTRCFVGFDDGVYRFNVDKCGKFTKATLNGGAIGARTADVIDFPIRTDDDAAWCDAMRERGAKVWAGTPWGYLYNRRSTHKHAWSARPVQVRRSLGGVAEYFGRLHDTCVDDPEITPIATVPEPTDAEVLADMFEASGDAVPDEIRETIQREKRART